MALRTKPRGGTKVVPKAQPAAKPQIGLASLRTKIGALEDQQAELTEALRQVPTRKDIEALTNQVKALLTYVESRFGPAPSSAGSGALRSRLPEVEANHRTPINANARREAGQERKR